VNIAVGADHAGFQDKVKMVEYLRALGHQVTDCGTDSDASTDYPDYAANVARAVADGRCDQGLLVCGTGIGMSLAANKVPGIRAAACQSAEAAYFARAHNDANVLCVGSRLNSADQIRDMIDRWLATPFEGGRHARRVEKIAALECERTG